MPHPSITFARFISIFFFFYQPPRLFYQESFELFLYLLAISHILIFCVPHKLKNPKAASCKNTVLLFFRVLNEGV
jgi:hypothetical protein